MIVLGICIVSGAGGCGERSSYTNFHPCITEAYCKDTVRAGYGNQGGQQWKAECNVEELKRHRRWKAGLSEADAVCRGEFKAVFVGGRGSGLAAMLPGWHGEGWYAPDDKEEGKSLLSRIRYNFETKMWTDPKTDATFKGGERVE